MATIDTVTQNGPPTVCWLRGRAPGVCMSVVRWQNHLGWMDHTMMREREAIPVPDIMYCTIISRCRRMRAVRAHDVAGGCKPTKEWLFLYGPCEVDSCFFLFFFFFFLLNRGKKTSWGASLFVAHVAYRTWRFCLQQKHSRSIDSWVKCP